MLEETSENVDISCPSYAFQIIFIAFHSETDSRSVLQITLCKACVIHAKEESEIVNPDMIYKTLLLDARTTMSRRQPNV